MRFFTLVWILLLPTAGYSSRYPCPKKDDQAALAKACESNISITSLRVECLADARTVGTIEFCARQYGSAQARLDCIRKIDAVK